MRLPRTGRDGSGNRGDRARLRLFEPGTLHTCVQLAFRCDPCRVSQSTARTRLDLPLTMCPTRSRATDTRHLPTLVRSPGSPGSSEPVLSIREVGGFVLAEVRYEPGFRGDILGNSLAYFSYTVNGDLLES